MTFLLWFALWATVAFVPAWFVAEPYQHALAAIAGRIAAPPGSEIEFVSLELFYPFDLSIYVALCLASTWVAWRRRLRAAAIGLPVLVVIEVASLVMAMVVMLSAMGGGDLTPGRSAEIQRLATGIIRVTGLIASSGAWFFVLGRERLSLAARTWLGGKT